MRIEAADAALADRVADLWLDLAAGQREHGSHLLAGPNRARIRDALARHAVAGTLLVARDGGLVGFVSFSVGTDGYEQDCDRGTVDNLYVRPARRGEGIGTALLAAAEDRLADRGVDAVALEVLADNDAARRFYRRAGYSPHRIELEKPLESDTHSRGDR